MLKPIPSLHYLISNPKKKYMKLSMILIFISKCSTRIWFSSIWICWRKKTI